MSFTGPSIFYNHHLIFSTKNVKGSCSWYWSRHHLLLRCSIPTWTSWNNRQWSSKYYYLPFKAKFWRLSKSKLHYFVKEHCWMNMYNYCDAYLFNKFVLDGIFPGGWARTFMTRTALVLLLVGFGVFNGHLFPPKIR